MKMRINNKKTIKRFFLVIAIVATIPILIIGLFLLFVPISRSDDDVRNYVMNQIPISTSWDDAVKIIENKKWEIKETTTECGLRINAAAGNVSFATYDEMENGVENTNIKIIGSRAILVELGEYYGPFHTAVFAYLAFDEDDKLIEVAIRRDIDSL